MTAIEPIAKEFTKSGWTHKLLDREGYVALFERRRVTEPERPQWEVVVIKVAAEHTWPSGETTPAHEAMPSSETWGTYGWTLLSLERARQKFEEAIALVDQRAQKRQTYAAQCPSGGSRG